MSKDIVMISGAPRQGGNTERLAAAFVEGAKSAGKNVVTFQAAKMKIGGCRGCGHCMGNKGVCIQKDDMPAILDALRKADAVVFVSPVYFYDMTAQLKLVIDRTFALLEVDAAGEYNVSTPIKKAALLMTCGDSTEEAAAGAVLAFRNICSFAKWENAGAVIATGLYTPGEIDGRPELDKARALGQTI